MVKEVVEMNNHNRAIQLLKAEEFAERLSAMSLQIQRATDRFKVGPEHWSFYHSGSRF